MRITMQFRSLAMIAVAFGLFAVGIIPVAAQDDGEVPVIDSGTPVDDGEVVDETGDDGETGTGGTTGEVAELPTTGSGTEAGSGDSVVFVLGTVSLLVLAAGCVWHQRRSA